MTYLIFRKSISIALVFAIGCGAVFAVPESLLSGRPSMAKPARTPGFKRGGDDATRLDSGSCFALGVAVTRLRIALNEPVTAHSESSGPTVSYAGRELADVLAAANVGNDFADVLSHFENDSNTEYELREALDAVEEELRARTSDGEIWHYHFGEAVLYFVWLEDLQDDGFESNLDPLIALAEIAPEDCDSRLFAIIEQLVRFEQDEAGGVNSRDSLVAQLKLLAA